MKNPGIWNVKNMKYDSIILGERHATVMSYVKKVVSFSLIVLFYCLANGNADKANAPHMGIPGRWRPSQVLNRTDAVIVGERGSYITTVVFRRGNQLIGEGVIRRLAINKILYGDISGSNEVLFFHPPSSMHEYVVLLDGKAVFFLRKLSVLERENITMLIPEGLKQISADQDLWTFATEESQWMSYINISKEIPTCRLGGQLQIIAAIDKSYFKDYIQDLIELRKQATQGEIPLRTNNLDKFQRELLERTAVKAERGGKVVRP